jgi:hypothetical protein
VDVGVGAGAAVQADGIDGEVLAAAGVVVAVEVVVEPALRVPPLVLET